MNTEETAFLERRVAQLEAELAQRDRDLFTYKSELIKVNQHLEGYIQRMRDDLKILQNIQKVLVPTEFPNIPGFEFSSQFRASAASGGDYFDIFEHQDRFSFGVVLASSTGYATSALLMSILLRFGGGGPRGKEKSPAQMISTLSQEMHSNLSEKDQADLFIAMIDRRQYELHFCLAGSLTALYFEAESGQLQRLPESHPPLSRQLISANKNEVVPLGPRDRLVLCSRGLVVAENLKGEKLGVEPIFQAVLKTARQSVHDIRNEILYQVQHFQQGVSPVRDQTILVMEVKDKVIRLAKS